MMLLLLCLAAASAAYLTNQGSNTSAGSSRFAKTIVRSAISAHSPRRAESFDDAAWTLTSLAPRSSCNRRGRVRERRGRASACLLACLLVLPYLEDDGVLALCVEPDG